MSFARLKAFHAVARWGGFSKAAEKVAISQPALSDHVRKLEQAYGVELFHRRARQVRLSPAGRKLFALTEQLWEAERAVFDFLDRASGLDEGELTLGADAAVHALPLISRFRRRHPKVRVRMVAGNSAELQHRLGELEIDLAITSQPPTRDDVAALRLGEDRLVAFAPRDHELAGQTVTLAQLADHTLVLREAGSATRALIDEAFAGAGISAGDVIEVAGREAGREAVAHGLGIGVIAAGELGDDGRLAAIEIGDLDKRMGEWLSWLKAREGLNVIKAMRAVARGPEEAGSQPFNRRGDKPIMGS